jgi:hypothetical protein
VKVLALSSTSTTATYFMASEASVLAVTLTEKSFALSVWGKSCSSENTICVFKTGDTDVGLMVKPFLLMAFIVNCCATVIEMEFMVMVTEKTWLKSADLSNGSV